MLPGSKEHAKVRSNRLCIVYKENNRLVTLQFFKPILVNLNIIIPVFQVPPVMKIISVGLLLVVLLASQSSAKPASKMYSENDVKAAFLLGLLSDSEANGHNTLLG